MGLHMLAGIDTPQQLFQVRVQGLVRCAVELCMHCQAMLLSGDTRMLGVSSTPAPHQVRIRQAYKQSVMSLTARKRQHKW